ncbi:MAG: molybdenum cofactor synthesis domain-containing protein [Rhodothermaceae bacterium]
MEVKFDENDRHIVSLNISVEKGTIKKPVERVELYEEGIKGDAHSGKWHRQVSMLAQEDVDNFSVTDADDRGFAPGEFAENITTKGIDYKKVAVLDRFKIGGTEMEVTQIGKKCHGDGCAIYVEVGKCVMPKSGIFTRVIKGGEIKNDDKIEYVPRPLKVKVITLSDRANSGEYKDLSGPTVNNFLINHYQNKRWHLELNGEIIPDEKERLLELLNKAKDDNYDIVITTGGTGIGPRDITPDVVADYSDKLVPGIMEHIRIKYGQEIPNALISRAVVGVKDKMIIYTLPGSVKAVKEYMTEILKTMEHMILMVHGLGH